MSSTRIREIFKAWREKRRRRSVESFQSLARGLLLFRLKQLLEDGYEKDSSLRLRGPLGMLSPDFTNQFEWFAATQDLLVEEFIRSVRIYEDESDARELIVSCRDIVTNWCLKHDANRETIRQCEETLREGVSKFRPIFDYKGHTPTMRDEFLQWEAGIPGLRTNFSMISLYLAEGGVLAESIRYGSEELFPIRHDGVNSTSLAAHRTSSTGG